MQRDIEQIKNICATHKTEPKLLIIPSEGMQKQVLQVLANRQVCALNLAVKSVRGLARDLAENYVLTNKLRVLEPWEIADVFLGIIKDLQSRGELQFLDKAEITPGLGKAVARTALELLENGYAAKQQEWPAAGERVTDLGKISNDKRRKDMEKIIAAYIAKKKDIGNNGSLDHTDIAQIACQEFKANGHDFVAAYALEGCVFNFLDRQILSFFDIQEQSPSENQLTAAPTGFFKAYGDYNEVKEVLRQVIQKRLPFDHVLIAAPAAEPYSQLCLQLIQQYTCDNEAQDEFPVTFGAGLPLLLSSAPKLLMLLLDWVESGYQEDRLNAIGTSGLVDWREELTAMIPPSAKESPKELLSSLTAIIKEHGRMRTYDPTLLKLDTAGFSATLLALNMAVEDDADRPTVLQSLRNRLKDIRILRESPAPGRIHLTTYQQAAWIERQEVFVVGLGAANFPGGTAEDPLLLDSERKRTAPLRQSTERLEMNIHQMYNFLNSVTGNLTCSYANFDTEEMRESYPSALYSHLKEAHPAVEEQRADFFLQQEAGAETTARFLDANDFWIAAHAEGEATLPPSAPAKTNEAAVTGPKTSAEPPAAARPALPAFSPTSLGAYLKCKYRFYLRYVLGIREIEEESAVYGQFPAKENGKLYHGIAEDFMKAVVENRDLLNDKAKAEKTIEDIAKRLLGDLETTYPTSKYHAAKRREGILKDARAFAGYEVEQAAERNALDLELMLKSGEDDKVSLNLGKEETESEELVISVGGRIDRIDRLQSGGTEIIDYKTGSLYDYREGKLKCPSEAGLDIANVQPVLYFLALKALAQDASDKEAQALSDIRRLSYRSVAEKGDYKIYSLEPSAEAEAQYKKALRELVREIENDFRHGAFAPEKGVVALKTEKEEKRRPDCQYCGYATVCKHCR
jgi:RecB family exonuclease